MLCYIFRFLGGNVLKKMTKELKQTKIVVGVIIIAVIGCFTAIYLTQRPPQEPEEPDGGDGPVLENIQDLMASAIADEKGAAKENVKICFYEQTTDNNIFAAGAVIRGGGTRVFLR